MVPKEELLEQVWGTRFVSESTLTSRIKAARRALGDDGREQRIIRTVHGRGYRFVAPLDADEAAEADPTRGRGGLIPVLEREDVLSVLQVAVADAASGRGRVVLVFGEAGIGKTSLVRAFLAANVGVRVLVGTCDDLVTPLPLGPLRDIASHDVGPLAAALDTRPPARCSGPSWPSSVERLPQRCWSSKTSTGLTRPRSTCSPSPAAGSPRCRP